MPSSQSTSQNGIDERTRVAGPTAGIPAEVARRTLEIIIGRKTLLWTRWTVDQSRTCESSNVTLTVS